jgi:hypothetical protein
VAAVIKELSSHLGDGVGAIASSWSLNVLRGIGGMNGVFANVYRTSPCRTLPAMPLPPTTGALLRVAATASDAGKGFRVTGSSKRHHTPRA